MSANEIPRNNLAELRKERGWAQADVGVYLHLTAVTICRHETHVIALSPHVQHDYARLHHVAIADLFAADA